MYDRVWIEAAYRPAYLRAKKVFMTQKESGQKELVDMWPFCTDMKPLVYGAVFEKMKGGWQSICISYLYYTLSWEQA